MNVAALLQDSPSDDSHRRRQPPPPSSTSSSSGNGNGNSNTTTSGGAQEYGDRGPPAAGERVERGERGDRAGQWDRTRVQSQNQNTWPPPYSARPTPSSAPSTPISTGTSPYAHKDGPPPPPSSHSWPQPVGNPYPPSTPQQSPPAPYDPISPPSSTRLRAGSNAAATHPPPTTGPGVPPPTTPSQSYMPPPDYTHSHPHHLHKQSQPPPPPPSASAPLYPTPVPVTGSSRLPLSHSPPIAGSPYVSGPPPPPGSSTPRRPQLPTPQPAPSHGPSSSHPSPAMASLQNPSLAGGAWGPGVPGPPLVDGRERELRDRTHPALTADRDRDRDRDMNPPLRDRERDWDPTRDQPRRRPPPAGPGVPPPPLAGPGTGAPPPLGPGVPPIIGPGVPDDPHKISTGSAPGSGVPSRTHSRTQITKDDPIDHAKEIVPRIPERELPPAGPGRTPEYPPRDYPLYRREPGEIPGAGPPSRRERDEYMVPGGSVGGSSRLPPPGPADYRSAPGDYRREPPSQQDYRHDPGDYRQPADYRREHAHPPQGDYRREPPPNDYRREPVPPAEYRGREGPPPPSEYRRDPGPPHGDYRDHRREPPPGEYRREPPGDYRREPPPPPPSDHRGPGEYREVRRDLPPPPGPGHSPDAYRREASDYRRERDPQDYPSSRRNSSEHRRERDRERDRLVAERDLREREQRERDREMDHRRGEPGFGHGPPPGERQQHRSPHQTRDPDHDPYPRRTHPVDYRREPPPGQAPGPPLSQDYRSVPHPPPPENYRADYRPPPAEYRRDLPPSDYSRRDHVSHSQDYRRDDYGGRPPPHPHGPVGPPPPAHSGQEYRGPPPPPSGDYRGPPGHDYRRDVPPGPPGPPQEYRQEYRGQPGSLPPPGDYTRPGPPPPGQDYRGREPGEIVPGPGSREYPRRERDREHPRDSGEYSRPPAGEYPRRRDDRDPGEHIGRSSQPQSGIPSGPGGPGRNTPTTDALVVKHPSDRDRDRERERAWERERSHYPPPPPSSNSNAPPPPPSANAPPSGHPHHGHSHSHIKPHVHHHHPPHHHHSHVIHQHPHHPHAHGMHPTPPSSGPGGVSSSGSLMPQPGQGGAPPPPSQRQLQGQFPTRFIPVITQSGSRVGSPVLGPGSGSVVPGGGSSGTRKDIVGSMSAGKDTKKTRPGGPSIPGSGPGRRERDEREREIHQPYPQQPPQPVSHRDSQGRMLGHGYPHGAHGHFHPHGQGYDEYMMVDELEQQQQQQQQSQHHLHAHPHSHPHQQHQPSVHQPPHLLTTPVGYYPPSQEGVEDPWLQDQADKEVKARYKIHLGTFVYPNGPFPYFFDVGEWIGVNGGKDRKGKAVEPKEQEVDKKPKYEKDVNEDEKEKAKEGESEKEKPKEKEEGKEKEEKERGDNEQVVERTGARSEDDDMLDVETRATIVIPSGYIPHEKPLKPRIWGGGVIGRPIDPQRKPPQSATSNEDKTEAPARPRKRRIYTDDSDLFLCALHSGWLTWSASARARDKGKDLRIEVRIIRCAGAGASSVFAVGAGAFMGKYAPAVNGVVTSSGASHRKNGSSKLPAMRKEEVVGRFIGGWGEKCFVKDLDAETGDETRDDEENDGRGLVSAGWGSGHDGSAIEVVNVEFTEKGTARAAPGLGRRNRSQRLLEYSERRAAVFGLQRLPIPPRFAGRKRRRGWDQWSPVRRLPNATILDAIPELQEDEVTEDEQPAQPSLGPENREETALMGIRTVVFATGLAGDTRLGYKYDPLLLKDILFPLPSIFPVDRPPPRKRRRTIGGSEDMDVDVDPVGPSDAHTTAQARPVILETPKESYLLSLSRDSDLNTEGRKYDISLILEGEVEEEREDEMVLVVADKNAPKPSQETSPPPTPPSDINLTPRPSPRDISMDTIEGSTKVTKLSPGKTKAQLDDPSSSPESTSSRLPSPSTTVPKTDSQLTEGSPPKATITTFSDLEAGSSTIENLTQQTVPTLPPQSSEEVSMSVDELPATASDMNVSQAGVKDDSIQKAALDKPTSTPPTKAPSTPIVSKHPLAQVLQRNVGEDMFRFTDEGVSIADGIGEDSPMQTEWLVQVKSWKWATRKIMRV